MSTNQLGIIFTNISRSFLISINLLFSYLFYIKISNYHYKEEHFGCIQKFCLKYCSQTGYKPAKNNYRLQLIATLYCQNILQCGYDFTHTHTHTKQISCYHYTVKNSLRHYSNYCTFSMNYESRRVIF